MKRTILLLAVLTLGISLISACKTKKTVTDNELLEKTITETFKVKQGKTVEIELTTNPSTGYSWEIYKNGNEEVAVLKNREIQENNSNMMGAPTTEKFIFLAKKSGETIICMNYKRPHETTIAQSNVYKIIVE